MTRIETYASNGKLPIALTDLIVASATKQSAVGSLLDRECFFIIECRICCNLFRTVTSFVQHKENVCTKAAAETESGFDFHFSIGPLKPILQNIAIRVK